MNNYALAGKSFNATKFADALSLLKPLAASHPKDTYLARLAAEAAVNTGDIQYAAAEIDPVVDQNPKNWEAVALQTRIYAESGNTAQRDAGMSHMADLYKSGVIPAATQQYLLERIHLDGKEMMIWHSLVPWGPYLVHDFARVFDSQGNLLMRITLESSDFDQPIFAQQHPKEAAAGMRVFSYDAYTPKMHFTYGFVNGQPAYSDVHARFVDIASGKASPMSSTTTQ